ncbi:MAG: arylsulfotransferase family protein [Geminicoccaceae bacterium]
MSTTLPRAAEHAGGAGRGATVAIAVSVGGLLVLAYLGGILAGRSGLFPAGQIAAAAEVVQDWRENWRHYLGIRSKFTAATDRPAGLLVHDAARVAPGYTFVVGYRDGSFHPFLLDPAGEVVHEWRASFNEAFPQAAHVPQAPPDWDVSLHGAALLADGSVVLNFEGLGTVKLDRCSQILWRLPTQSHHALDLLPDGGVLVTSRRHLTEGRPGLPGVEPGDRGWLWEDTIVHADASGHILSERSVLQILLDSGLAGLLYANGLDDASLRHTDDPLHLNDIEALRPELATAFPQFAAGDIMISLRNLDTIAVLDRETLRVKWSMTGPFLRQHDPDFLPNGHILLFDNRKGGAGRKFGQSRVLEIDPRSRSVVWSFAGSPEQPFYTDARGKVEALPNGNVLVTEAQAGRVFELARTPQGGTVVAEWVNGVGDGLAGYVTQADRIPPDRVGFLGAACPAAASDDAPPPGPG